MNQRRDEQLLQRCFSPTCGVCGCENVCGACDVSMEYVCGVRA